MKALHPGDLLTPSLRLVREIGAGGMSVVWLAEHLRLGTHVAVKLMSAELFRRSSMAAKRFATEARITAKINHPNIVRIFDHGTTADGDGWMSMELLEGESLRSRIERGVMSSEECCAILDQVATALEAAHQVGVVHRDIKPDNIFVRTIRGRPFVKVLDFGVALVSTGGNRITGQGVLLGTPEYMSPEQLRSSRDVDHRADLWGLAVVAYEALTGQVPFSGVTVPAILLAIGRGRFTPPSSLSGEVGPALDAWFERAFSEELSARFATAEEFSATLYAALDEDQAQSVDARSPRRDSAYEPRTHGPESMPSASQGGHPFQAAPGKTELGVPLDFEGVEENAPSSRLTDGRAGHTIVEEPSSDFGVEHREQFRIPMNGPSLGAGAPSGTMKAVALAAVVALLVVVGVWLFRANGDDASASTAASSASAAASPVAPKACPAGAVEIPGGRFSMGSSRGESTELPVHAVEIAPFCLDQNEVSVARYRECVIAGGCSEPGSSVRVVGVTAVARRSLDRLCNGTSTERADHPVNCVDWAQAREYCTYRKMRLPTEEEWEFAARGGDLQRSYPWGDRAPGAALVNACDSECRTLFGRMHIRTSVMFTESDGYESTAPTGRFVAGDSRWGVHDMAGNVLEWTESGWSDDYAAPRSNVYRVVRGGAWSVSEATLLLATARDRADPSERNHDLGFRCAASN